MRLEQTGVPGCFTLHARVLGDDRGRFVKTFEAQAFAELGLAEIWSEEVHTTSRAGVIRGMHFQTPPFAQAKLVFCVAGAVTDVVVDLRHGSPVYGKPHAFDLSAENGVGVYIPRGVAHGFAARVDGSTMFYKIAGPYAPEHDGGVAWDSVGFDWGVAAPTVSERDRRHPALADYVTPFALGDA